MEILIIIQRGSLVPEMREGGAQGGLGTGPGLLCNLRVPKSDRNQVRIAAGRSNNSENVKIRDFHLL